MNAKIRLRYAPSPTGFLHIGNTRTALFNYLMAKHYNGTFILRIEDTDIARNVPGAIESQFANLAWLGIVPDESMKQPNPKFAPYTQLERLPIYMAYAEQLIKNHLAYYCFCTHNELEADHELQLKNGVKAPQYNRKCLGLTPAQIAENLELNVPYNIRFKVPADVTFTFNDLVRGTVSFESKDIGDWVLIKSNGIPTYNYAVVIDDYLMQISHVIRGEEHISNTPRQLMIFSAFGWEPPVYAHLTLIVNEQHKKLSKRDGNIMQFIEQYKNMGYLPAAMFNFISLLGWSPVEEREIYQPEELIKIFDETRWSKSPSMFDVKKLQWMNNEYIKALSEADYLAFIKPFLAAKYDLTTYDKEWIKLLLTTYQKELIYGEQIQTLTQQYFVDLPISEEVRELWSTLTIHPHLKATLIKSINELLNYDLPSLQMMIKTIGQTLQIKGKDLFMPIRILASHQSHGPELYKVLYLLGKDRVLTNINQFK